MPLRILYILFILTLHGCIGGLLYYIFQENKWYFLLSELGLLGSFMIGLWFYRKFNQPLELMKFGVDAIKDEDYNVRFLKTGSESINELIDVFNAFLEKLSLERVKSQEQAYFLESIIKASPVGMIMLDYDDLITHINESAQKIFKTIDLKKEIPFFEIDHSLTQALGKLTVNDKEIITIDSTEKYKCQISSIIHLGFRRKFVIIEEMTKELLKNEKAAYGKVIRMMAHEVNNSMGAVNSILQTVVDFGFNEDQEEFKESIIVARDRNEELALFMKNFADVIRLPPPQKEKVNLKDMAHRSKMIMSSLAADQNVEIVTNFSSEHVYTYCDIAQIQQVFVNTLKNAIESIGNGGKIVIRVWHTSPQLTITDNGAGISDDVKEKLFSPFFSTKPTGQGIGLIISRDILLAHDAKFRLFTDKKTDLTHFAISFY